MLTVATLYIFVSLAFFNLLDTLCFPSRLLLQATMLHMIQLPQLIGLGEQRWKPTGGTPRIGWQMLPLVSHILTDSHFQAMATKHTLAVTGPKTCPKTCPKIRKNRHQFVHKQFLVSVTLGHPSTSW